ncbi:restriction endonuclease [Sphingopyxis yananensis]|uniref:restriction endonuclease n=1 Tax=Sphingopyxis yananensis TaxID=2886687 RepID=UPI001D123AB6|nr:restriction endonuclease [Sphingopyxis yananensis]MCC2602233.1 restriction endonuclease [Sphingopyxis yananensis]
MCGLVQQDVADVYEELYSYFAKRPEDLHRLHWREFETLLFRIFQAQGFTCELGPGSNDGGIDVRVLQRDPLGDILTLVQAKRYAPRNKIDISAVAALHGVADVELAQKSMFVTTSDYLPSARKFAGRTRIPMTLATSADVSDWCRDASDGIIRDKSKLITPHEVSSLLQSLTSRDPRIVRASTGYSVIMNQFAIILKETKHAALLMAIPARTISHDGYGQRGSEVPDTGPACLDRLAADTVFRAKRSVHNDKVSYWDGRNLYSVWDGVPAHFDLCD